jgi:hypothetical protein
MTRFAGESFDTIRPDEQDFFAFDFNKEIGTPASFIGSITGDTLTVTQVLSGTVRAGYVLGGTNIAPITLIIELLTGIGGIGTYRINTAQTVPSTHILATAYVMNADWTCTVAPSSPVQDPTPQMRLLGEP